MQFTFCIKCYFIRVFPRAYLVQCILNDRFDGHIMRCFLRGSSGTSVKKTKPSILFFLAFKRLLYHFYSANKEFHLILRSNIIPIYPNITFLRSAALAVITSCALQAARGGRHSGGGGRQLWCLATSDPQLVHTCWLR